MGDDGELEGEYESDGGGGVMLSNWGGERFRDSTGEEFTREEERERRRKERTE